MFVNAGDSSRFVRVILAPGPREPSSRGQGGGAWKMASYSHEMQEEGFEPGASRLDATRKEFRPLEQCPLSLMMAFWLFFNAKGGRLALLRDAQRRFWSPSPSARANPAPSNRV